MRRKPWDMEPMLKCCSWPNHHETNFEFRNKANKWSSWILSSTAATKRFPQTNEPVPNDEIVSKPTSRVDGFAHYEAECFSFQLITDRLFNSTMGLALGEIAPKLSETLTLIELKTNGSENAEEYGRRGWNMMISLLSQRFPIKMSQKVSFSFRNANHMTITEYVALLFFPLIW